MAGGLKLPGITRLKPIGRLPPAPSTGGGLPALPPLPIGFQFHKDLDGTYIVDPFTGDFLIRSL